MPHANAPKAVTNERASELDRGIVITHNITDYGMGLSLISLGWACERATIDSF